MSAIEAILGRPLAMERCPMLTASQVTNAGPARALAVAALLGLGALAATACQTAQENTANGAAMEAKGKSEAAVGAATGDNVKKVSGEIDEDAGKAQKAVGNAEAKIDRAVDRNDQH